MTEALTAAGCRLAELAARRGLTVAEARALLKPFLAAGLIVEREDGRLELIDGDIAFAIASEAPPA